MILLFEKLHLLFFTIRMELSEAVARKLCSCWTVWKEPGIVHWVGPLPSSVIAHFTMAILWSYLLRRCKPFYGADEMSLYGFSKLSLWETGSCLSASPMGWSTDSWGNKNMGLFSSNLTLELDIAPNIEPLLVFDSSSSGWNSKSLKTAPLCLFVIDCHLLKCVLRGTSITVIMPVDRVFIWKWSFTRNIEKQEWYSKKYQF